ncbi:IclR family transcriptional regulator [Actinomadura sp. SCN-SB]|uniref:IclR family transcriptional regulator n=1 Tax=Actinomadura sp. SCN-SB TaxID=3373092 RepID=UPI0037503EF3
MQSVVRSLRVLEEIAIRQPVGVGELARALALPKTSVQRCLAALAEAGWIRPAGTEFTRWTLTSRALAVGRKASAETSLREAALGPMHALREATGETIHLAVPNGPDTNVLIERVDSVQAVRTFTALGTVSKLHLTSSGRAILAHLDEEEIDKFIALGLPAVTEETITDPDALRQELRLTQARGYALNIRQSNPQVCAIGAAVLDADGRPVAGLALSVPSVRFDEARVPEWGDLIRTAAEQIRENLGHL